MAFKAGTTKKNLSDVSLHSLSNNAKPLLIYPALQSKNEFVHFQSIADTSIKRTLSLQSTPMIKKIICACLIWQILPLVIKKN